MGSFSNWAEDAVLKHVLKQTSMSQPTNLYVALCKSTIDDADTGSTLPSEVSGGSYARKRCNTWSVSGTTPTTGSNNMAITYAEATANWGTVTDFAVVTHSTTGQVLAFGELSTNKKIGTSDTAKFATGDLDITLD